MGTQELNEDFKLILTGEGYYLYKGPNNVGSFKVPFDQNEDFIKRVKEINEALSNSENKHINILQEYPCSELIYRQNPFVISQILDLYDRYYHGSYIRTIIWNGKRSSRDYPIYNAIKIWLTRNPAALYKFDYDSAGEKYNKTDWYSKKIINEFRINEFVQKNPELFTYEKLPEYLRKNEGIIREYLFRLKENSDYRLRDSEGYDAFWKDIDGNLKEWFKLKNGYKIKSKKEYMSFVEMYLGSDCTVPQFCHKFQILNPDGFNKMLDRVIIERPDLESKINNQRNNAQQRYLGTLTDIATKIANGEQIFEEMFEGYQYTAVTFDAITTSMERLYSINKDEALHNLAYQICSYINNHRYTLNIKAFSYFMGEEYLSKTMFDLSNLYKKIKSFFTKYGFRCQKSDESADYYTAIDIVGAYSQAYNPEKDVLISRLIIDGKEIEITKAHRDQLIAFLELNKLSKTKNVAKHYLMEIAKGNIDYNDRIDENDARKDGIDSFNQKLSECRSIDEYLTLINNKKRH